MKTLRNASICETLKVRRLNGEGALKRRLMDMGLTNGCEVFVRKVAPLGDPVEITVRGYELSVRRSDAPSFSISCSRISLEMTDWKSRTMVGKGWGPMTEPRQ